MSQRKHKLVILDDHPLVLEGLVHVLSKSDLLEIIGTFINGADFMLFFKGNRVDVVLLDLILPDSNGMDLCKEIKAIAPETVVLALTNHEQRSAVLKMLENGANGYVLKNAPVEELEACIHDALQGHIAFSNAVKKIIAKPTPIEVMNPVMLTTREKEVLKLIAQGMTTRKIAEKLFLSKFTVENYRKNLLQKLEVKNMAALINAANQRGLL